MRLIKDEVLEREDFEAFFPDVPSKKE
jgi:hypothetical protein